MEESALCLEGWAFLPEQSYVLSRDLTLSSPDDFLPATPCCIEQDDRVAEIMDFSFFSPDLFALGENYGCLRSLRKLFRRLRALFF